LFKRSVNKKDVQTTTSADYMKPWINEDYSCDEEENECHSGQMIVQDGRIVIYKYDIRRLTNSRFK